MEHPLFSDGKLLCWRIVHPLLGDGNPLLCGENPLQVMENPFFDGKHLFESGKTHYWSHISLFGERQLKKNILMNAGLTLPVLLLLLSVSLYCEKSYEALCMYSILPESPSTCSERVISPFS